MGHIGVGVPHDPQEQQCSQDKLHGLLLESVMYPSKLYQSDRDVELFRSEADDDDLHVTDCAPDNLSEFKLSLLVGIHIKTCFVCKDRGVSVRASSASLPSRTGKKLDMAVRKSAVLNKVFTFFLNSVTKGFELRASRRTWSYHYCIVAL
eukprot:2695656-Amphidinium_carterae.1